MAEPETTSWSERYPDTINDWFVMLRDTCFLIVDDQALLAMDLAEIIESQHGTVIGPATTLSDALRLVDAQDVHAALLDIEIGPERVWPLARHLSGRQTPFAFISGQCTAEELPEEFTGVVCLEKPPERAKVLETALALKQACRTGAGGRISA